MITEEFAVSSEAFHLGDSGNRNQEHQELLEKIQHLREQYRWIEEASRLKSEFIAAMSHELRTPLNCIIGFAEIMHDGKVGPIAPDHKEYLGDILNSGRHLLRLINDVLDLAKVEAGKMEFRPEAVALRKIISETCDIARALAAKKRIAIEARIEPKLDAVVLDATKLKQVLYNFLSNAIKFTPEGGLITLHATAENLEEFRIEVKDSGGGIKTDALKRLFVEFQQLDTPEDEIQRGTGLGLALTKKIVEAQGGRVGVSSIPGKGSTFFAVLPCRSAAKISEHRNGMPAPYPDGQRSPAAQ